MIYIFEESIQNIWLTQKMMAIIYGVELPTINEHIKTIFKDRELLEDSTIRNFQIVQKEGNREVNRFFRTRRKNIKTTQ